MVNKHKQVICDVTKIILDDGVTIYPGYIEVKKGKIYRHFSDDPNNLTDEILKNRKEYEIVKEGEEVKLDKRKTYHFVDRFVLNAYLAKLDKKQNK